MIKTIQTNKIFKYIFFKIITQEIISENQISFILMSM